MRISPLRARPALVLAAFAMAGLAGCEEKHQPPGTNASTGTITDEGPGGKPLSKPGSTPGETIPTSDGMRVSPPVVPPKDGGASGEANSGKETGKSGTVGSDATTEGAKPATSNPAPTSNGSPPR